MQVTKMFDINNIDISLLNKLLFIDEKLQVKPIEFYKQFTNDQIRLFAHVHGIYVFPTSELIKWLKLNIIGSAIEIGAGNGAIARNLNIPITDSRLQEDPMIMMRYISMGQPVIKYPNDVEKLTAEDAVKKYNPETVIGAYITHKWYLGMNEGNEFGVDENDMLKHIKKYINIGNLVTHKSKPILHLKHEEYYFDWLLTRAAFQKSNRIFVWTN